MSDRTGVKESKLLDFSELSEFGDGYYAFTRHTHEENGKQYRGYLYVMCRALTDDEKSQLIEYDNVRLYHLQQGYSPERVTSAVFLTDRRIRTLQNTVLQREFWSDAR